jgi:hypothetical protein
MLRRPCKAGGRVNRQSLFRGRYRLEDPSGLHYAANKPNTAEAGRGGAISIVKYHARREIRLPAGVRNVCQWYVCGRRRTERVSQ